MGMKANRLYLLAVPIQIVSVHQSGVYQQQLTAVTQFVPLFYNVRRWSQIRNHQMVVFNFLGFIPQFIEGLIHSLKAT
jgi:hypothetical protein